MGNKVGWILAGVLVAGLATVLIVVAANPSPTKPTAATLERGALDLKTVSTSLTEVIGREPSAPGNAGDDYQQAIDLCKSKLSVVAEAVARKADIAAGRYVPSVPCRDAMEQIHGHVARGAAKHGMQYTFVHTPRSFTLHPRYKPAMGFQNVAAALEALANYYVGRKEFARAEGVLQDELVMGRHLMNERSRCDMVRRGLAFQTKALGGLIDVYNAWGRNSGRMDAINRYRDDLLSVRSFYTRKLHAIWQTRPKSGDVFNIAENDKDRAFRVEAVLFLGILKFTDAKISANLKKAEQLMEKYAASDEPMLAAAATAARTFTREQFDKVGQWE